MSTERKTIIITGSTDGIGRLAAIKLAKDGHTILLHGRNREKLLTTESEIKNLAGAGEVKGLIADFSDLNSVKKMAQQIKGDTGKIEVLLNNAGIYKSQKKVTTEGLDIRMAVNYFAPFLLTQAILPLLKRGKDPRIINVSSAAQRPVDDEFLSGESEATMQEAYAESKLALTMWSFWLANKEPDVQVIAVNPGSLLNTKMVHEVYGHHWSPAEKGGNILYDLAVSEEYKGITGQYYDNDKGGFGPAHADAYEELKVEKLIYTTRNILKNVDN